MRPLQGDPEFIKNSGRAVFSAMTASDPDAVWVMQGWLFKNDPDFWTPERSKALLTSVPLGRMLILDLQAELTPQYLLFESFYGQPFIFCLLHNFGGTLGMYGAIPSIAQVSSSFDSATVNGGKFGCYDLPLEGYRSPQLS